MSAKKDQSRRNIAAMAREAASEAVETLIKAMRDPDLRVAVDASKHILDRAIGKPIAMTADVTDRLDEFTDDELDAAITAIKDRIGAAGQVDSEKDIAPVTH